MAVYSFAFTNYLCYIYDLFLNLNYEHDNTKSVIQIGDLVNDFLI